MTSITIALDDAQAARLKRYAEQRGQTLEEMVQSLIETALPDALAVQPPGSTLGLAGIIDDPSVTPLSAREIDEVLAADAHEAHASE
ncbi:MAG TPA: hypothetical protein VHB98_18930 [Chloroflexota bacterium]|nr:hypothetical protein [Chloroflexota bacterium]